MAKSGRYHGGSCTVLYPELTPFHAPSVTLHHIVWCKGVICMWWHLRSALMNRGDLTMAHKAKCDCISSTVKSSLTGSPTCIAYQLSAPNPQNQAAPTTFQTSTSLYNRQSPSPPLHWTLTPEVQSAPVILIHWAAGA